MSTRLITCLLVAAAAAVVAPRSANAEGFRQGSVTLGAGVGWVQTTTDSYVSVGVSGGYYVVDGLELGLGVTTWLGASPNVTQVSPRATYTLWFVPQVHPYVGTFYRHWFIANDYDDIDSWGLRAGLALPMSSRLYVRGGVVWEQTLACERDCTDIYPELAATLVF